MRRRLSLVWIVFVLYLPSLSAHPGDHKNIAELDSLLETHPDEASLLVARGATYTQTGQWEKAETDFHKAKRLNQKLDVNFEFARLYFHTGNYPKSLKHINQYIKTNPDYGPAYQLQARAASASRQATIALNSWSNYFEKTSSPHPGDYIAAAQVAAEHGALGVSNAIQILDSGIEKIGLTAQLQRYAMELELKRNDPAGAHKRWLKLEPQLGATAGYKITMARILLQMDRIDEATLATIEARSQLATLKKTPARQSLNTDLFEVEEQLKKAKS